VFLRRSWERCGLSLSRPGAFTRISELLLLYRLCSRLLNPGAENWSVMQSIRAQFIGFFVWFARSPLLEAQMLAFVPEQI